MRIKAYLPFTKAAIQMFMAYGFNFWMYTLGSLLRVFVVFYLWDTIYRSSPETLLEGYAFLEMVTYIFIAELVTRLVYNDADWFVADEVKSGSIASNLIKPISYHLRIFFMALGQFLFELFVVCLPIWIVISVGGWFLLGLTPPSLMSILLFLLSVFLSFVLMYFFNMSFGFLAFYLENMWGMAHVKYVLVAFLSGLVIPVAFFPQWIQKVLEWLPFGSFASMPLQVYLGKLGTEALLWGFGKQLLWIGAFALLSQFIYSRAINRLTINGG